MPYKGGWVPLVGPQGIFKPKILPEIPLTITTVQNSPYQDEYVPDGEYLLYKYRGTDPEHRDNKGLRAAMLKRIPLIYFFGVGHGKYFPAWPIYIVGDDPGRLTFKVEVGESVPVQPHNCGKPPANDPLRRYLITLVLHRLHQQQFRERVLYAYREQCAMCRLKHPELLEAIHIIPDKEPGGEPVVKNGIALCRLHHTAFDRFILGIRPDYVIQVREDVLREKDGPILLHGFQELNDARIQMPRSRTDYPDPSRLEVRYEKFKSYAA